MASSFLNGNNTIETDEWTKFQMNGKELPLHLMFQMLKGEYGSEEAVQKTGEFCMAAKSEANQRIGLEFLYAYGYLEEMKVLIEKNLRSSEPQNRQWGLLYKIIHDKKSESLKPSDYLTELDNLQTDEQELVCLKDFLYVYAYFEQKQFGKLGDYMDKLIDGIHEASDPLVQELFIIRFDELLMTYHWKRNEMLIARKHGYRILNRTYNECKKADVHEALALGFIFDSYEQAMYHANEALRLAKKHECQGLIEEVSNHTIPFIAGYFGRAEGIETIILSEQAHLALARGNREECIRLLNDIDELTPFQLYYLGRAKASRRILEQARWRFITERSDYFFARLPMLELQKMKVST